MSRAGSVRVNGWQAPGEGDHGMPGLPDEVVGCLAGT
jgi:hypothetical protein